MELYKKTNTNGNTTEYIVFPEDNDRPREWYDGYGEDKYDYHFVGNVKRGEKFYIFVCRDTQDESEIYWDYEDCKIAMVKYARDYVADVDDPANMSLNSYKVLRCTDAYDKFYGKRAIDMKVEDFTIEEE